VLVWVLVGVSLTVAQTVSELPGHQGAVSGLMYSADGKLLVSSGFDRMVRLWDGASKGELRSLPAGGDMALAVALPPGGGQILAGVRDGKARLWNIAALEPTWNIGPIPPSSDFFSLPDDRGVVALGLDGFVRLYALADGKLMAEFKAHDGGIRGLAWSADQSTLYTAGDPGLLKVWKGWSGEQIGQRSVGEVAPRSLALLVDGSAIVTADPNGLRTAWRLPLGERRPWPGATADVVRLLHAGSRVISLQADGSIHVHDSASGTEERVILPGVMTTAWAISPVDQETLLVAGEDKALRAYRWTDGALLGTRGDLTEPATAVALGPMAPSTSPSVWWGDATGAVRNVPFPFVVEFDERVVEGHSGAITSLSRSSKSGMTLSASADRTLVLRDAVGNPIRAFSLLAPVRHAALAPTEDRLAAVGADNVLRLWLVNGAEQKVVPGVAGGLAFSPDGRWLAFGGADNKAFVCPTDLSAEPRPVATHGGLVRALVFSSDSQQIATGGADNVIKWSDVAAGNEIRALAGHQGPIQVLALSPDGKLLASGSDDKSVRLWNTESGAAIATFTEATAAVTSLAFAPDGATWAAGAADHLVRVYRGGLRASIPAPSVAALSFGADARQIWVGRDDSKLHLLTEREPNTVARHTAAIRALALSQPAGVWLAAGDDNLVRTWEIATGKPLRALAHGSAVTHLAIAPDGTRFASAEASGKVRLGMVLTGESFGLIEGSSPVTSLAWSPSGASFAVMHTDGTAREITAAGAIQEQTSLPGVQQLLPIDTAGTRVVAGKDKLLAVELGSKRWQSGPAAGLVRVLSGPQGLISVSSDGVVDARDSAGTVRWTVAVPAGPVIDTAPLADGSALDLLSSDLKIRRIALADGKLLFESNPGPAGMKGLEVSKDGTRWATLLGDGSTLWWTSAIAGGTPVPSRSIATPGSAGSVRLAGSSVISLSADQMLRFFASIPPESLDWTGHQGAVYGVAFRPDGQRAATASADGTIILWETATNAPSKPLQGHRGAVYSVAFSADGGRLLSAGTDKELILWDAGAGTEIRRFTGATEQLYQVAFVPGTNLVLAAGVDRVIRLWDAETGNLVQSLEGHPDEIYGLALRPDGAKLASVGNTGQVIVWDRATGQKVFETKLGAEAYAVSFRPDGGQIAVGIANGKIQLIDLPDAAK
jgi:WD40 repeat protein